MLKVIGIVHSVGNYQGVDYDNFNLQCTRDAASENENEDGLICEIVKVKSVFFLESPIAIGDTIDVSYDKYGRIKEIINV